MTNFDLIHVVEQQSGNCAEKKKKTKTKTGKTLSSVYCLDWPLPERHLEWERDVL